ncbi:Elongation of very long chain fatty acids protein 7 [Frankliniella fusca]|uniref:Elongation of very long chain fatty acids protein n=1 Tax=Frankliniella fusca TaxID=407009 RepID=A0AAE1LTN2_9NEOP|nr:Elongation of very long chain fatty acids protein 7 [Frankliniella fusca]
MAAILGNLYANYRSAFEQTTAFVFSYPPDPRTADWFMVSSATPVLLMLGAYLYFVLSLGPRLMRDRKPINCDKIMIVYNAVQVVCSLHVVRECLVCCYPFRYNIFCEPINFSATDENAMRIFFVLRKKTRQISFLHVYHHTGMVIIGWLSTKFIPGGHGAFLGLANCSVHAVLYSHYLVTILYPELGRNAWWKKYITQMQMVQFGMLSWHWLQLVFQPNCMYPKFTIGVMLPQNAFMFLLFYDFYRKTYNKGSDTVGTASSGSQQQGGIVAKIRPGESREDAGENVTEISTPSSRPADARAPGPGAPPGIPHQRSRQI